jgi:hypothetical protein
MARLLIIAISLALLGYVVINVREASRARQNHEPDNYHAVPVTKAFEGIFGSLKGLTGGSSNTGNNNSQSGGYSVRKNSGEYLRTPATYERKSTEQMRKDFYPDEKSTSK